MLIRFDCAANIFRKQDLPDGYNIGAKLGKAEGQTRMRVHLLFKMLARLALLSAGLLACASATALPDAKKIPDKATSFTCTPQTLPANSTVTIDMSVPHGWELGVRDPKGEFFILTSCAANIRAISLQDLGCEAFSKLPRLQLRISELAAPYAGSAYKGVRPVFKEKGRYVFFLAKNLETENEPDTYNRCEVDFTGEKPGTPNK